MQRPSISARLRVLSMRGVTVSSSARAQAASFWKSSSTLSGAACVQRPAYMQSSSLSLYVPNSLWLTQSIATTTTPQRVCGYGLSGDAHHITAPSDDGSGAFRCMNAALSEAAATAADVALVNAHATSTPLGDAIELRAIARVLQQSEQNSEPFVTSTKGATGHLLGAAGAVEALFTVKSVHEGVAPGTANFEGVEEELSEVGVRVLPSATPVDFDGDQVALSNSFGFGGTNATLAFKRFKL